MARQPKMYSWFAKPGAGKTTALINVIKQKVGKGDRAIVVDPDGCEAAWDKFKRVESVKDIPTDFKGVYVVPHEDGETFKDLQNRLKKRELFNFMLVLDDPNVYATPKPEPELSYLLKRKRQFGMDILTTAHGWGECPQAFMRFIDIYIIGPTDSSPTERQSLLTKAVSDRHMQWKQAVNKAKSSNPGSYPWAVITRDGRKFSGQ